MAQDNNKNREWDVYYEKEVVFYNSLVNAWLQNRLDRNKQLLTISYLAIGLLLLLFPSLKDYHSDVFFGTAVSWFLAFISFIASASLALSIMRKNADYAQAVIRDEESQEELSTSIRKKTNWLDGLFWLGAVFTSVVILLQWGSLVYNKYGEEQGMNEKSTTTSSDGNTSPINAEYNIDGIKGNRVAAPKPQTSPAQTPPPPTTKGEK